MDYHAAGKGFLFACGGIQPGGKQCTISFHYLHDLFLFQ
jgi:hypothetical protein